jgi:hypothetical protein
MPRATPTRACLALLAALLLSCGSSNKTTPDAAPPTADAAIDAPADGGALASCLEQPTDLPRPPSGQLPCELLPPGFPAN